MKRSILHIWLGIGLLGLTFEGCNTIRTRSISKEVFCPPPPSQDCYPQRFIGRGIDTVSDGKERFLRIETVEGLNIPIVDEWNISFLQDSTTWNTASAGGSQVLRQLTFRHADNLAQIIPFDLEEPTSIGFITGNSQNPIAAYIPLQGFPGDAGLIRASVGKEAIIPGNELSINSVLHWDSHPALSPNGTFLFFVSDRESTLRGTDIYVSMKVGTEWLAPINCGSILNSKCDELSPFVAHDGKTLLFSSSGHANVGGYDIFMSMFDSQMLEKGLRFGDSLLVQSAFEKPINFGVPVNTIHDELFPSSPSTRFDTLLYYSSNQANPKEDFAFDIFVLHPEYYKDSASQKTLATWQIKTPSLKRADRLDPKTLITIEGKIIDQEKGALVKNAEVTTTLFPENEVIDQQVTDTNGRYKVRVATNRPVRISAESDELFDNSVIMQFSDKDSNAVISDPLALPKTINLRMNFPTNEFKNPYEFILDSNGYETTIAWKDAIIKVASNLQRFQQSIGQLTIIGHTDEVGSNAYNIALGKRRADFVIKELIRLGVPPTMLTSESKGEEELLQKRISEDTEQFKKRCRRVEMVKVLR